MLFLELAAQGVRGFSPSIRVALKPGYSALKSPSDLPAPLAGLVAALAFPDGRGGDAAFLAPGAKAGRAGLSIQAQDGSVWRIVRDLGGAGGLHKLNRATNQFDVVSQDAAEMAQSLRAGAGFPARTTWEQLFTLTGPQLPTRRPKGPARPPGATATAASQKSLPRMQSGLWATEQGGGGTGGPLSAEDGEKLKALEAELGTARRAAELQFRMDGITSEIYGLESKARHLDELRQKLETAKAEQKKVAALSAQMPDDIVERATRYPDERKRFEAELARLREDRYQIESVTPGKPSALYQNQEFLLSVGGGVLLFVLAVAMRESALRYLSLASVVPFTFAALMALRYIEGLQRVGKEDSKTTVISQREKKLTDEFQLTTMVVQKAFEQVNALTLDEFLAEVKKRDELKGQLGQMELEWADFGSDPENADLEARLAKLKADQDAANQELLSMSGGYVREVRDIERDIARLKDPGAYRPSPSGEFAAVPTGPTETWEDPTAGLMVLATDLFATDVPSLWSVLHDRAVQYLTALTDKRYHDLSIDKDGHATLEAPGRSVVARELPGKDLDLMFLALRLTLIEKAAPQHKLPVVIEDTFNTVLDATKQPLFARMVKHLGTLTQVLHVSGAGQNATLADTPTPI